VLFYSSKYITIFAIYLFILKQYFYKTPCIQIKILLKGANIIKQINKYINIIQIIKLDKYIK